MIGKSWKMFFPAAFVFLSCEKAISFRPAEQSARLVVEATIEEGKYPIVYLSRSLDFFSKISLQSLSQSFVHQAAITISDGASAQQLKEYSTTIGGYALTYYTVDSSHFDQAFKGRFGASYQMTIVADGEEYKATTTIPLLKKPITTLYVEDGVDKHDSTKVSLFARFDDPPGLGNYIRYFTRLNHGPFYPGLNSVYDDQVIDGKTYDVRIDQGVDRSSDIDFDNYAFFHKGDTVTVKLCNIDKATYDFWRTMEYSYSSIGNPFSSPAKVVGNISNDALGYFGGYAVQYSSIIIPK